MSGKQILSVRQYLAQEMALEKVNLNMEVDCRRQLDWVAHEYRNTSRQCILYLQTRQTKGIDGQRVNGPARLLVGDREK